MKKLLNRRTEPTYTLMDTSVRAEEEFEEERAEMPDLEKSLFGDITSFGA